MIAVLHIAGFLNAYLRQTDQFTDVIYALSFALIAGFGLTLTGSPGVFKWTLALMVIAWSLRLAIYLGYRIQVWGKDRRFDDFRQEWPRLARFWAMQFISIIVIVHIPPHSHDPDHRTAQSSLPG